jgi:ATP-dependent protease HslVU (ClpYQ) peptidase subunit
MDVTEHCAVGSGSKYALGALRVLFDQEMDAGQIAQRSVQVGIDYDVHCGGPIEMLEIT